MVRTNDLKCLICNPEKGLTSLEQTVQNVLLTLFANVEVFPQCRALSDFSGPTDFCLLIERVLIQVDGDSHSGLLRKSKAQEADQPRIDDDCNTWAIKQGWHMLRIDKADVDKCAHVIQDVLLVAKAARLAVQGHRDWWMSSVTWSRKFGRQRKLYVVKRVEVSVLTS